MRLCARRIDPTPVLPYVLPFLVLFLLPTGCDDAGGPAVDGGDRTDAGASDGPGGDAPPASGPCSSLTTTTRLEGSVSADATWRGAVAVSGEVRVGAFKITIEPGTTFVMGPDASIELGWNSAAASVFARGTAAAPIRFCGREAGAGYYDGIIVGDRVTSDSLLEHVLISDGGQQTGAALQLNGRLLVKDVQVSRSGADGVHARDFAEGSARLTVTGAAKLPVALRGQGAVSRLPLGGSYLGNGTDGIALRFTTIDLDTSFRDPGVPYLQEAGLVTRDGARTTFAAGVDYRLAVDQELEIGWNNSDATVMMEGTAEKPVLFGRTSDGAGGWKSIIVRSRVRSDSIFKHVKIRGGGNGGPALDIKARVTVDHLTLEGNQTGLNLEGPGLLASSALTITGTAGPPATVEPDCAVGLPKGGTFTGNTSDWIVIKGGAYTGFGTLFNLDVPYRVAGVITTRLNSALQIEAGTTLVFSADASLQVGWNGASAKIIASGAPEAPIVFKGAEEVAGYWDGLSIGSNVTPDSKLDFVEIRHAGKADGAALDLDRPFVVIRTKLIGSAGLCIRRLASDTGNYASAESGNVFDMCAAGNVGM
jgi:hypothetical protein